MKKTLIGGFYLISGTIFTMLTWLVACIDSADAYHPIAGIYLTTIFTSSLWLPFMIGIILFAWGLNILFTEQKKDEK